MAYRRGPSWAHECSLCNVREISETSQRINAVELEVFNIALLETKLGGRELLLRLYRVCQRNYALGCERDQQ
jgi:hypothetical protein